MQLTFHLSPLHLLFGSLKTAKTVSVRQLVSSAQQTTGTLTQSHYLKKVCQFPLPSLFQQQQTDEKDGNMLYRVLGHNNPDIYIYNALIVKEKQEEQKLKTEKYKCLLYIFYSLWTLKWVTVTLSPIHSFPGITLGQGPSLRIHEDTPGGSGSLNHKFV